jgi:hypothetical protein
VSRFYGQHDADGPIIPCHRLHSRLARNPQLYRSRWPCKWFTTTRWTTVLNAQDPASPLAKEALEKLCQSYWYLLYFFIRRQGHDEAAAKDLTQGFFAKLLEKNYLASVRPEKGKFRMFFLASIKHFVADERDEFPRAIEDRLAERDEAETSEDELR